MSSKAVLAELGRRIPGVEAVATEVAGQTVQHLLGFWVLWHAIGGLEPLIAQGFIARSSIYRQRAQFHRIMHVEVENFWPEMVASMAADRVRAQAVAAGP